MQNEPQKVARRRTSSNSTVRTQVASILKDTILGEDKVAPQTKYANLWIHDEAFSQEDVLISQNALKDLTVAEDSLLEVAPLEDGPDVKDTSTTDKDDRGPKIRCEDVDYRRSNFLCLPKLAPTELISKQPSLELSIIKHIASSFGLRPRARVKLTVVNRDRFTASHIEIGFRDAYVARSDMWRFVSQELVGRTVYVGQKISFVGSLKLTVKAIHLHGHRVRTAYVASTTVPVFRSEAARYVLFIQMSREMWDFDSEGSGEILFNRVINGFLPDLFERWTELEVKHLVSIVLFSRLEYDRHELPLRNGLASLAGGLTHSSSASSLQVQQYEDFYRVVVTDMASAQWSTILNELKKDFRVFQRDLSLHEPQTLGGDAFETAKIPRTVSSKPTIAGRPSSAIRGNVLEAINIASTQFAHDFLDRDLIRTGISIVVITAGTGVFEVDRDLLNLTSENLTNNGIGIDIVCLSKMPLHSVPLFKYRTPQSHQEVHQHVVDALSSSPIKARLDISAHALSHSPALSQAASSTTSTASTTHQVSRLSSSIATDNVEQWSYGIPQWIDLSYWTPANHVTHRIAPQTLSKDQKNTINVRKDPFVPRVRMYEVQMMGIMELGMADISIPLMSEGHNEASNRDSALGRSTTSLSVSPSISRRGLRTSLSHTQYVNGPLPASAKSQMSSFRLMDDYDEQLFANPLKKRPKHRRSKHRRGDLPALPSRASGQAVGVVAPGMRPVTESSISLKASAETLISSASDKPPPKRNTDSTKMARNFSYALRGLAPPVRASAQAEITSETVQAQPVRQRPASARRTLTGTAPNTQQVSTNNAINEDKSGNVTVSVNEASETTSLNNGKRSQPMKISQNTKKDIDSISSLTRRDTHNLGTNISQSSGSDSEAVSDGELAEHGNPFKYLEEFSMHGKIPFIRSVNPSNPLKQHGQEESLYGRWQHLYPRKPKAATVKWRSLCTPASVPLTTAEFPSRKALEESFERISYTINSKTGTDVPENKSTAAVVLGMINLRIAHGYQMIVGSGVEKATAPGVGSPDIFFDPSRLGETGQVLYLSMGNTIQRISPEDNGAVSVTRYWRKSAQVQPTRVQGIEYKPRIKTILAHDYLPRNMELKGFREHFPWQMADEYMVNSKMALDDAVDLLHYWRARFVLLPVEPPQTSKRAQQIDETDEEIHLLGIRALTQMWQKNRHVPTDERKRNLNRNSTYKRKDPNPLEVDFRTTDPSEVVATELDRLLTGSESTEPQTAQLLPESELFDRYETELSTIAQAMQGDKGLEIKARRWHFRLYLNAFHGEEFTSWLLHNFKNIDTREEALEFGNQLMEEGLFEHVNKRHNFKDGHYFYAIKSNHIVHKSEPRSSWFAGGRRSDKSIPPTPLTHHPLVQSPALSTRARSSSKSHTDQTVVSAEAASPGPDKKRISIWLSKMIKVDVDPRRRSNRPEVVNLHYDRIHNPENCYHLELSWLNVTSKLVDDAVVAWATQAEKYGLKLVEVPIAEACQVMQNEPFRAPYQIRPVIEPPRKPANGNTYFTITSFAAQPPLNSDKHLYQKALLKRFNFVLDVEAASEFPDNVDVQYSWGKLQYRYTQFVHRSGVILAQITDDGTFLLLANRLYNSRSNFTRDTLSKYDTKRDPQPHGARTPAFPAMQASGIIALNVQSPSMRPSPMVGALASADVLGPALPSSSIAAYVTPEQIKNDLEVFCHDRDKLETFYKEVSSAPPKMERRSVSTSSSALRPVQVRDPDLGIPDLKLPERLIDAAATAMTPLNRDGNQGGDRVLPGRRTLVNLEDI